VDVSFKRMKKSTIEKAKEVDLLFIAEAMGEDLMRQGRAYFTYQNEGENTASVAITPSKGVWKNFGGVEGGNDAISFYAYRNFHTSSPEGKEFIESVIGVCGLAGISIEYEDGSVDEAIELKSNRSVYRNLSDEDDSAPKQSPDRLDFVYRHWMNQLFLTQNHIEKLEVVRKINSTVSMLRGYRSFGEEKKERYKKVKAMMQTTKEPEGIPGFALCQGKYGPYWTALGKGGMFIPYRDISNHIVGFQIRYDEPLKVIKREGNILINQPEYNRLQVVDKETSEILWDGTREQLPFESPEGKVTLEDGPTYAWFASMTYKKRGILLGTMMGEPPYHCAVPSRVLKKWKVGTPIQEVMDTSTVWWGEGALKGDISSDFTDELHLQAAGVNSWRSLIEPTLEILPKRVIFSFDADAQTKEGVKANVLRCIEEAKILLSPIGIKLQIAIWPADVSKGIDDLINAGYKPTIIEIQ